MRRSNFIALLETETQPIIRKLEKRGVESATAHDAFQSTIEKMLSTGRYNRIKTEGCNALSRGYISQAVFYELRTVMRKQAREEEMFVTFDSLETEEDQHDRTDFRERLKPELQCPFCHVGILNQYQACADCHTIVAQGKGVAMVPKVNESELAVDMNLELTADVKKALKCLTHIERVFLEGVVGETHTLSDLAILHDMSESTAQRIYAGAKAKLRKELADYA